MGSNKLPIKKNSVSYVNMVSSKLKKDDVDFIEKIKTVSISPKATPTRKLSK